MFKLFIGVFNLAEDFITAYKHPTVKVDPRPAVNPLRIFKVCHSLLYIRPQSNLRIWD